MNNQDNKTAIGLTLGCRLNQADTALIFGRLENAGFSIIKPKKGCPPDVIIINTCTVTANAAQKSRQTARHFKRKFPDACLIVTGCDCNKAFADWEQENYVDFVLPNSQKKHIPELVATWKKEGNSSLTIIPETDTGDIFEENALAEYPFKSRAFLKVQEGCDAYCTYCIVPHVRGPERSRKFAEVIAEAEAFIQRGHREIIITGVNISTYKDGNKRIVDLLKTIVSIPGNFRLRLSSMEPHPQNKNLVTLIKNNPKICRFLHVPLQSGNNEVLKQMGRSYTSAEFAEFAKFAIAEIPGLHLGTDVIVGFPGETDAMFRESCEFIKSIGFANMHVFRFSPREGTPAATFPDQVPQHTAKVRADILGKIADECKQFFIKSQLNQELAVLLEKENDDGSFAGWSDNYVRVTMSGKDLRSGEIFSRRMTAENILSF